MIITRLQRFLPASFCLILVAVLSLGNRAVAQTPVQAKTAYTIDSLYMELSKVTTAQDSVMVLHNLYDCVTQSERKPVLTQIFETAEHAGDYNSMLEVLFLFTSLYQNYPEVEEEVVKMAERIPDSEIKQTYLLYNKLRYQATNLNKISETERQQRLHRALKDYRELNRLDKYNRIACLFLICTNLRNTADSDLLIHYLQQLQDMIEEFPTEELAVRTLFYTLAIDTYIENGLFDKAIEANKHILEIISKFDKRHEAQGRIFRTYDGSLYQAYLVMLICAQELTDDEIDMYYNRTLQIADKSPSFRNDFPRLRKTLMYYLMAKKRYAEALPLLKDLIKKRENKAEYYRFANLLVKAASETGDKESLLEGMKIINSIRRERLMAKSDVSISELQTIYDVENLKGKNQDLTFENQNMEIERRHQDMIWVTAAGLILIIILIWMSSLYIHSHGLAKRLSVSNRHLMDERNSLKETYNKLIDVRDQVKEADRAKSDFVENMSGDIREPLSAIVEYTHKIAHYTKSDDRPYIREYSDAMIVNSDLLIRLVNDILDLPKIESGELSIQRTPYSVKDICNFALELIKKHVAPGVEIVFANVGQPDSTIVTDPHRVQQVLIQILTNAAKFTEEGSITFGYEINDKEGIIEFSVTDTGIGVPAGMEEKIFERFEKIDTTTQGNGLGLYVGRRMATMLGGYLILDSSYVNGARFIFTLPIR